MDPFNEQDETRAGRPPRRSDLTEEQVSLWKS